MPFSMSDSLDSHLTQLKREPIPRLDGRFLAGVWEAIERMRDLFAAEAEEEAMRLAEDTANLAN